MVEVYHVSADVARCGFLTEKVAAAGDAMREWQGGNGDGSVFVDGLWSLGVYFVNDNFVWGVGTEVVDLWLEDALQVFRSVDVEVLGASEESEGGEHSYESKSVVTV